MSYWYIKSCSPNDRTWVFVGKQYPTKEAATKAWTDLGMSLNAFWVAYSEDPYPVNPAVSALGTTTQLMTEAADLIAQKAYLASQTAQYTDEASRQVLIKDTNSEIQDFNAKIASNVTPQNVYGLPKTYKPAVEPVNVATVTAAPKAQAGTSLLDKAGVMTAVISGIILLIVAMVISRRR